MFMCSTDASEIRQIILPLQPRKITSHDNLSPLVIKWIGEQIAMPLYILINMSMYQRIVPDELKIVKLIHVHKSNAKDDISNYRPIKQIHCYLRFQKYWETLYIKGLFISFKLIKKYLIISNMFFVKNIPQ